jgi:hypothetical protein
MKETSVLNIRLTKQGGLSLANLGGCRRATGGNVLVGLVCKALRTRVLIDLRSQSRGSGH